MKKLQRSIKDQRDLLEKEILSLGATFENEEDLITKFKQKYNENGSLGEKMAQLIVLIEKKLEYK